MVTLADIWEEGYQAYWKKIPSCKNPYYVLWNDGDEEEPYEVRMWSDGYFTAHQEKLLSNE